MSQSLAVTVFSSGALDELRTIDAYGLESAKVINSITLENDIEETIDNVRSMLPPSVASGLGIKLPQLPSLGLKLTSGDLAGTLGNLGTGLSAALAEMPLSLQNNILAPTGLSSVMAVVDGVTANISNFSASAIESMGNLMSNLSGVATAAAMSVVDISGISNLGANLVRQATAMGIPNPYQLISAGINNPAILTRMTKQLLPVAIATSSISLLEGISKGPIARLVPSLMPRFIPEFSRNFTMGSNVKQKDYPAIATKILQSFDRIDPQWSRDRRSSYGTPGPFTRTNNYSTNQINSSSKALQTLVRSLARTGPSSNQSSTGQLIAKLAINTFTQPAANRDTGLSCTRLYGEVLI